MARTRSGQQKKETMLKINKKTAESVAEKMKNVIESETKALTPIGEISRELESLPASEILMAACRQEGLTEDKIAKWLHELMEWKTVKFDKNGNAIEFIDGSLRVKAIEILCKIMGSGSEKGGTHQHLHLQGLSDDKLNALIGKTGKS